MSKFARQKDDSKQLSILDLIKKIEENHVNEERPGSYDLDVPIREELSLALKKCPQSRYWVAGRMAELSGRQISKEQVDSWTSESKVFHNFPLKYFIPFIKATNNADLLRLIVEKAGYHLAEDESIVDQELGKIKRLKEELSRKEKEIIRFLERREKK